MRMSRLSTLLLSGPAPPDAAAVWFGDLPLECCYGPSDHPRAMGLWFPKLAAWKDIQDFSFAHGESPRQGPPKDKRF
jgi:hypothetical protein